MTVSAACCRCGQWYEVAPDPAVGFDRHRIGLCGKCRAEVGDLDKAIEDLRRKVHGFGEDAKDWRRKFNDAVSRRDAAWNSIWGADGKAAGFFGGLGTVAVAGGALEAPGGEESWVGAGLPEANPDTSFAGMVESIPEDNFRPENLPTAPTGDHWDPFAAIYEAEGGPPIAPPTPIGDVADPITSRNPYGSTFVSATSKTERSLTTSIRADVGEWQGYGEAVFNKGEIGILPPGKANARGLDFGTASRNADGELEIFASDAKTSTIGSFPEPAETVKAAWKQELSEAIDNFDGDPGLRAELRDAFDAGRVYPRQVNIDYSPSPGGQGAMEFVRPGDAESAAAAEAVGTIARGLAFAAALLNFAKQTDGLSTAIGEYYQASKEAEDWQKLLDKIDQQIDDTNKKIQCLLGEQKNQRGEGHG
jgi:soluble cytochrome b562